MDMSLVSSISDMQQAKTAMEIGTAVAAKVMKTTSSLQMDLLNQMMGIGQNLNVVA